MFGPVSKRHSLKPGLDPGPWTLDSGLWTPDEKISKITKKIIN